MQHSADPTPDARRIAEQSTTGPAARLQERINTRCSQDLIRVRRNFDSHAAITSRVYQIARNFIIDHYRSKSKEATAIAEELADDAPEAENLNELAMGWLPYMISKLPDGYREAVELYELQGLPQQEIAGRLELSLSGAKSRVQRGRENLKSVLFDCCSFEKDRRGNLMGSSGILRRRL